MISVPDSEHEPTRLRTAAHWLVADRDSIQSEVERAAWKAWISVPANKLAFDEAQRIWRCLEYVRRPADPTAAEIAADGYDGSVPVSQWLARRCVPSTSGRPDRRYLAIAASLALAVSSVWIVAQGYRVREQVETFTTAAAGSRDVRLVDGSMLELAADTAVRADIAEHNRTLVLERGEATFQVAHDAGRPFNVLAGSGTITAVGTAFNVRKADGFVYVTVTEGVVQVTLDQAAGSVGSANAAPAEQSLKMGESIAYSSLGHFSRLRRVDVGRPETWRYRLLEYQSSPLRDVFGDLNRYSNKHFVLDDAMDSLAYSGTVSLDDLEDWIDAFILAYPELEVTASNGDTIAIRKRSTAASK